MVRLVSGIPQQLQIWMSKDLDFATPSSRSIHSDDQL